jgi:hypothetical protein
VRGDGYCSFYFLIMALSQRIVSPGGKKCSTRENLQENPSENQKVEDWLAF